jgi:hypothetical protein
MTPDRTATLQALATAPFMGCLRIGELHGLPRGPHEHE